MTQSSELLTFNVGGRRFATTRSTVFSHGPNFLAALVKNDDEKKIPCVRDEKGRIFIDRSPDGFAMVLDFLRSGQVYRPPGWSEEQIAAEFDFYQIGCAGSSHLRAMLSRRKPLPDAIGSAMEHWREMAKQWVEANHEKILAYNLEHVRQGSRGPALQFAWHDAQFVLRELSFSYEWGLSALWRSHVAELLSETLGASVTLEYSGSSSMLTMYFQWA